MPPKRKATGKAAAGGKKAKKEEADEGPKTVHDHIATLKAADAGKQKKHKVDDRFPMASRSEVYKDYDCMLNQTNIGHNNNKYYVIQVLKCGTIYYSWNRWGRVGETGMNKETGYTDVNAAIKDFEKKFKDKTKNNWADREKFKPVRGKYTMIEMAGEDDDEDEPDAPAAKPSGPTSPCTLDAPTQSLMKLIFDNDMFREAMKNFDIDVKKMPLGKLSKTQIAKGFECLDEIEKALNANKPRNTLTALSSKFYTLIPHDFGRRIPPAIDDLETLRSKMDMLLVLGDIELAQEMQKEKDKMAAKEKADKPAHPLDVNYNMLKCDLEHLDPKSKEYQILETYTENTKCSGWRPVKIKHIWKMNRHSENERIKPHDKIVNRKLLWHGTNVAVVAAILKSGLRIMPHSGGRVGRGIYFASENGKSAGYTRPAGKRGIMFLNEAILGKENHIDKDNSSLTQAPKGYDCVIAKGWTEPDPSKDTFLMLGGKKVTVPQGKPVSQPEYHHKSSFSQSEYLVYQENQVKMRYIFEMEM